MDIIAGYCGYEMTNHHHALADAEACAIIAKQSGCAEILNHVIKTDYWDIDAMADAIYSIITYPAMYKQLHDEGLTEVKRNTISSAYLSAHMLLH